MSSPSRLPHRFAASAALLSVALLFGCSGAPKGAQKAPAAAMSAEATRLAQDLTADARVWNTLATLCDTWGHRLSGSPALEGAIDWAVATLKAGGIATARREAVQVPTWVRGEESAVITKPAIAGKPVQLVMLGLGNSVGTAPEGVTAPVVVVHDEAELKAAAKRVPGKIVLFNNPMPQWTPDKGACYGKTVRFRVRGASKAAALGAAAVLVRSVTAHSLRSPHTGMLKYDEKLPKIPAAAVSTEDADRLERLVKRGDEVVVRLKMAAVNRGMSASANVVAEIRGRDKPDEIVIVSGHIDSWDVGQGAHDDGAGVVMAMQTLMAMKRLGLRPRRTIRAVLWTNEENGMAGVKGYLKRHAAELGKHVAALEADAGGFAPVSWGLAHRDPKTLARASAVVRGLLKRLAASQVGVGALTLKPGRSAPDVGWFKAHGVPALGLYTHGKHYFDYHHTHADTIDKVDPKKGAQPPPWPCWPGSSLNALARSVEIESLTHDATDSDTPRRAYAATLPGVEHRRFGTAASSSDAHHASGWAASHGGRSSNDWPDTWSDHDGANATPRPCVPDEAGATGATHHWARDRGSDAPPHGRAPTMPAPQARTPLTTGRTTGRTPGRTTTGRTQRRAAALQAKPAPQRTRASGRTQRR